MTTDSVAAVTESAALAFTLRTRMADLYDGASTDDSWSKVAIDALAGITALAVALPSLRTVSHWTDVEAHDTSTRPEIRAIAAVRSLDVRVRRATGRRVIALRRR